MWTAHSRHPLPRTHTPWLARGVLLGGMALYWLLLMHLPLRSGGGWGTDLPVNLLGAGEVGLCMAGVWLLLPGSGWHVSRTGGLLLAGAVLMSLPLLWSPSALVRMTALPRVAAMWGLVMFFMLLRRCRLSGTHALFLLNLLAMAGGIQTLYVLYELHAPPDALPEMARLLVTKYGRYGTGVFGQANVTASFLALTLGVMLLLADLRQAAAATVRGERIRRALLGTGIVLTCAVLVLLKSRTGWLGGLAVIAGMAVLLRLPRLQRDGRGRWWLLALPLAGIALGIALMSVSPAQALREHDGSNRQRLLTLKETAAMMRDHPLAGFGAGSYESAYQAHVASLPGGNPGHEMMNFPHNELLFQYAEGGIPALAGALLWGLAWLGLWRSRPDLLRAGMLLAMVPVLLHIQLEYPLYYAVSHGLALLMLAALASPPDRHDAVPRAFRRTPSRAGSALLRTGPALVLAFAALTCLQALWVQPVLDRFEDTGRESPDPAVLRHLSVPWLLQPRWQHDLSLLRLVTFRTDPDPQSLTAFARENAQWLSVYADEDGYRNQIAVLRYLQQPQQAQVWRQKAERMFPWERASFGP
ncbi:TPA: O-antigen ligase C-terminal domain-containing protein [Klebsiella aerogenes]|nr:O-antigen ligase C-terminal domain-containing protein [Klebsiella aerogenes]